MRNIFSKVHMNSQFTRQGVNYVLKKYGMKAREKEPTLIPDDLTAHKMRHTAAMELITSGVDLMYIRDLLGHSRVMDYRNLRKNGCETEKKSNRSCKQRNPSKRRSKNGNLIPI